MSPPQRSLFANALIVVAMRWTDRLIGLVSTLILARILTPEDFGIIAMASVLVGLVDVLLDLGVNMALIQNANADDEDYHTAWTIRLIQSAAVGAIIFALAPLAADYYRDPRVADVTRLMAVGMVLGGFENIGVVCFQKSMAFGQDFRFFFIRRLAGFVVTIALAVTLESYWAMPLGALAGRFTGVVLSYTMHPFRPRFSLSRVRHLWSFSQWALIRSIGVYFDTQFDRFLVGRISGASTMGAYTLATEIAQMPSTELLQPLGRVLFPAFVATKHDPARLREAYLVALAVQALLAIPAGVGLACVADRAVMIMLGAQWESAIPFVQTLALVFALAALSHAAGYLLITIGKIRTLSLFVWVQNIVFLSIAGVMFSSLSALDIAHLRLGVAAFGLVLFLGVILLEVRELHATDLLRAIWRPATAAGLMALSDMLVSFPDSLPLLLAFLLEVALGALSYSVALLGLWALSGRPQGAEAYILAKLKLSRFLPAAQRSDAQ